LRGLIKAGINESDRPWLESFEDIPPILLGEVELEIDATIDEEEEIICYISFPQDFLSFSEMNPL